MRDQPAERALPPKLIYVSHGPQGGRVSMVVTWGEAFSAAIRATLYTIVWYIIGGIIAGVGAALLLGVIPLPLGGMAVTIIGSLIIIIGVIIILLGVLAAVLKVLSETVAQEVVERMRR